MEEFLQYIVANWCSLLESALFFLLYFLAFLYDAKMKRTKVNLHEAFKIHTDKLCERADALTTQEKRIVRLEKTVEALLALDCKENAHNDKEVTSNEP